jgi:hypothetical protein
VDSIDIQQTTSTPRIIFDAKTSVLEFFGESYPENSFEFYEPIFLWLKNNLFDLGAFRFDIKISYMNSSSIKCVLDMLDMMEEAHKKGIRIEINWYYDQENPRAFDLAEEFQEEVTLPFHIIPAEE